MSENKAPLVLTAEETIKALRCCATNESSGGGHRNCPMDGKAGRLECSELLSLMAADRLEELSEEVRKLRDATEGICQRQLEELIRLAGEANTALDRGLVGVNEGHFSAMMECQSVLSELGRESVIRAEPVGEKGWRILGVRAAGRVIFGEMESDGGGETGELGR